jgi:hypothetical protein
MINVLIRPNIERASLLALALRPRPATAAIANNKNG